MTQPAIEPGQAQDRHVAALVTDCLAHRPWAGGPTLALGQTSATATAAASAQIVDPVGILAASSATSAQTPTGGAAGMAQLSGGGFAIQGPANLVVSVSTTLPPSVERAGGGQTLPVTARAANPNGVLALSGLASFDVAAAAPVRDAPAGLYTGVAEVLVSLD